MTRQSRIRPSVDAEALPLGDEEMPATANGVDIAANLRATWSAIFRNRLLILGILSAAMLCGFLLTMLMTPKYRAGASVQIDQQTSDVLGGGGDVQAQEPLAAWQDTDRFLQTQIDVLQSRGLAIRVMNSLNLNANLNGFVEQMGEKPIDKPLGVLDMQGSRQEQVIKILMDNLDVSLPRQSRVIEIYFKSPDPRLAKKVSDSFATNFIMSNLQRKFDASAYARTFLQQQLVDAKRRLEDSERALLAYSRAVGLIDASAGVGSTDQASSSGPRSLVTSDLVQLNGAYTGAQSQRIQAQQRWQQALRTPLLSLPEVLANGAYNQLAQLRAQAQASYDEERTRHKPDYPSMIQLQARISGLDQQINTLALSVRDSLRDQYLTALSQETGLLGNVNQLKRDTLSEQDKSVQYNILKRETDTNRAMYDTLLQRFQQVSAQAGVSANNISLVDYAAIPLRPISPRPLLNLAAAALAGLLAAAAIVLIREKFDDAVRSPDDVSRKLGITFLNSIPLLRTTQTPTDELADPRSALSEAYATLRTSLELVNPSGMPKSILLTSSRQSEGKSTSARAVAEAFAKLGRQVVLVDADLRKPSLHRLFGGSNSVGFSSVLARHRSIEDALQPTDTPGLAFLSSGPLPPNPAELLSGAMLPATLQRLEEQFDLVIIDGPPVLGLADAVLLATNTDGTVFVIEANGSHHGHAKAAIRRLVGSGANILGAVLTKYDARKVGYGGEYGYYYYSYGREVGDQG